MTHSFIFCHTIKMYIINYYQDYIANKIVSLSITKIDD